MKQRVGLNRKVFDKNKFEKTIDNSFEEIIPPTDDIPTPEPTIGQFFQDYATLFYDIPAEGATNSHQFLVEQSGEYINFQDKTEEIQALRAEIANLRRENLNLQVNNLKDLGGEGLEEDIAKLENQIQAVSNQQTEAADRIQTTANSLATTTTTEPEVQRTSAVGYFD